MNLTETQKARFWSKVDVKADYECWPWRAAKNERGYGSVNLNGKHHGAHRIAFQIVNGPLVDGMCACHHCDVPECVNPAHLFAGTISDNIHDAISKGRVGGPRKVTQSEIEEIIAESKKGVFAAVLAKRFDDSTKLISRLRSKHHIVCPHDLARPFRDAGQPRKAA